MRILHIFDASNYISAGNVNPAVITRGIIKDQGIFRPNEIPVGGINFLLNTVNEFNPEKCDLVYAFDSHSDFRYELHERVFPRHGGYKGNRPRQNPAVIMQRKLAMEVIKHIGLNALRVEGYEADDIIYKVVTDYKDSYDMIYVHTLDSDLFYLVASNVQIAKVGSRGKSISMQNYEESCHKDKLIPFNTNLIEKMATGDTSDNIPHMPRDVMDLLVREIPENYYPFMGNPEYIKAYLDKLAPDNEVAHAVCDLILPHPPLSSEVELVEQSFNFSTYKFFCINFGNKDFVRRVLDVDYAAGEELIQEYLESYNQEVK